MPSSPDRACLSENTPPSPIEQSILPASMTIDPETPPATTEHSIAPASAASTSETQPTPTEQPIVPDSEEASASENPPRPDEPTVYYMSEESSSSEKQLILQSSDGDQYVVDEIYAMELETIKCMVEEGWLGGHIPLANVDSEILAMVLEYSIKHVDAKKKDSGVSDKDLKDWDAEFLKMDKSTLFDLILAANYLNAKKLLDRACTAVADMMRGKTTEEIRMTFDLKNDYTPEEEAEIRREMSWAFE